MNVEQLHVCLNFARWILYDYEGLYHFQVHVHAIVHTDVVNLSISAVFFVTFSHGTGTEYTGTILYNMQSSFQGSVIWYMYINGTKDGQYRGSD